MAKKIRIAVLGATGYTGIELLRHALRHPHIGISVLTADKQAGKHMADIYPHLRGADLPKTVALSEVEWQSIDCVFCCLPHGTTQEVVAKIPNNIKVIDLSADFRLRDLQAYETWYGHAHLAPELQPGAVYGLPEIYRDKIKQARLVASPGCYPTSAILPLYPLLKNKMIEAAPIIVDSKSGVSGAGRALKESSLYAEVAENFYAYGVAKHRHTPEIEQELSAASGEKITISFTPHLLPQSRGILSTIYVQMKNGFSAEKLHAAMDEFYGKEKCVRVLPLGETPMTASVKGTNLCLIGVCAGRLPGQAIVVSAIDNLVKGASGQAIQSFNIMHDFEETLSLSLYPLFP